MSELLLIYLWLKLDSVSTLLTLATCAAGMLLIVLTMWFYIEGVDSTFWSWPPIRRFAIALAILLPISILIPNSKDLAILVGAHYAIEASKTPEAAKVMTLIRRQANKMLDEALAEGKK